MELVFLMVILKIPIAYLGVVVYRAIKAVPENEPGEPMLVRVRPRPRPSRPRGGPVRGYARSRRTADARADRVGRG
jgi:hypothetical protein